MKIRAEFDSNEELVSFISTFSTTTMHAGALESTLDEVKVEGFKIVDKPDEETPTITFTDGVTVAGPFPMKSDEEKPKTEITKEMVRGIFTKIIKAGKQKEAKELTEKYGASKLPDLKVEDYPGIFKEAEALI